jgi:hypothetical protein
MANDSTLPKEKESHYDVALSYAGENREFVEGVYNALTARGISTFFDRSIDAEIEMWGKDLLGHLHEIYGTGKATYCVAFISDAYQKKAFPTYELQNAVAHAVTKNPGYVLPVLLEGDQLPSPLVATTVYVSGRDLTPEEVAEKIVAKVGIRTPMPTDQKMPQIKLPRVPKAQHDPYSDPDYVLTYLVSQLEQRGQSLQENGMSVSVTQRGKEHIVKVKHGDETIYNLAVWLGGMTSDDDLSFFQWNDRRMPGSNSMHAFGEIEWSQEKNAYVIKFVNFGLFRAIGTNYIVTPPELVEMLWERIIEEIEEYHERKGR